MGEKADEAKGRVKEAAGDLTGDKDLEREGQMDQAGAKVKKKVGNAAETAKDKTGEAVDKAKDKARELMDRDDR
jgi:uncharacterized protein YjbJ (UPF0337 family)